MIEFFCGEIDNKDIELNPNETAKRLMVSKAFQNDLIDKYKETLKQKISAKYIAKICHVKISENKINLGFTELESRDLAKNLKNCKKAYVFAVTLGIEVDRFLMQKSVQSPSEHFIIDAIFSAYAEGVCDSAEKIIKANLTCNPRFSAGYGDFPLSIQKNILEFLEAKKYLNISLTNENLMIPTKSITAIMGIVE